MARILLSQNEGLNIASDNAEVIGAAGVEKVIIFDNAPFNVDAVKLDQNVERAELAQANSTYKYQAAGNVLKVFGADGKLVMEMPVNTSGAQTIAVGDGSMVVKFETSGANAGKITVGGTPVVATVGGAALVGATLNAAGASTHGPVVSTSSTFSIAAATASAAEGNSGTTNLSVTVSRTGDITKVASVTVATADGTATIGDSDYVAVTQVVSFAAGESTKTISLAVNGDAKIEANETFSVALSAASAGDSINAAAQSVSLTITNDDVVAPNQTFVLTANPDGLTGGDGDDQFVASDATLSAADVLNGAAGNDTLRYASSFAGAVIENGFATSNIENIRLTSDAAGGTSFDMTGVNGATVMANDNSSTNLALTGVKTILDLELLNVTGGNTSVAYQAGVVSGAADTQKILLNNVKSDAALPVSSVTVNGIETFAVTTAGTSSRVTSLTGDRLTKVTLAGDKDLSVQNVLTGIATVDATAFTGKLTATVDATQSLNVTGGTADDVISVSGNLGANDTLNGGAGTDTLSVSNAQATGGTSGATITNFEYLGVTDAASGTIDMDNFVGFSKVILDGGMGGNVTIQDAVTGVMVEVDQNTTGANNLTVALKTDSTADTATILFDDINNNGGAPLTPDAMGVVTANQIETLNLEGSKLASGTSQSLKIAGLNASAMKTLNIKSDAALTLAASTTPNLTKVDASASTGNLNLNALGLATTGATVTGGTGADTINAGTGADTLTGGAGKDVFVFEVGDSTGTKQDTITDFVSGTDSLNLANYGLTAANQFVGVFNNFGSAQGALLGGESGVGNYATTANNSVVFEANFDGTGKGRLWLDNGDGTLDANDNRIILKGVSSVTAADMGLAVGNTVTLTASPASVNSTTNSNATGLTSAGPDTINTTVANLNNATVNGAGGADKLVITDAVTVALTPDGNGAGGNLSNGVTEVVLNAGTSGAGNVTIANDITKVTANAASAVTLGATNRNFQGSTGNDTISTSVANLAGATVNGAGGTDTLAITDSNTLSADLTLSSNLTNIENVTLNGTNGHVVTLANIAGLTTTVSAASNVVLGNGGQTFVGSGANDIVFGDTIAPNNDTIGTGAGDDVITVGRGDDKIDAGAGDDAVNMASVAGPALTSADTVAGGADLDTLTIGSDVAGSGNASGTNDLDNVTGFEILRIQNNSSASTYITKDTLVDNAGVLSVDLSVATSAVTFNGAAETNGSFVMVGSAGNDVLTGGAGDDWFIGSLGNDIIDGGAGADIYYISNSSDGVIDSSITAMDTIQRLDVSAGTKDRVDLEGDSGDKTTLNFATIANADIGALAAAINMALTTVRTANVDNWNGVEDVLLLTIGAGTAAGTYLLSNEAGAAATLNTFDATDVIVKIGQIDGVLTTADFI